MDLDDISESLNLEKEEPNVREDPKELESLKHTEVFNLDKLSLSIDNQREEPVREEPKVRENNQKQLVPYTPYPLPVQESIDLEKIKAVLEEDGTLMGNILPKKEFPIRKFTPVVQQQTPKGIVPTNSNIKKISIKFTQPIKKKRPTKKTTLLDEAADSDSSEMIFKS
jgi:hypothetical protein